MIKKVFITITVAMLAAMPGFCRQIKGTFTDSDSEPLIGATIKMDGETPKYVTTDIDGQFFIEAPDKTVFLDISYIGFKDQRVRVPIDQNDVTVVMGATQNLLDELVVVGYGVQKKVNLTGAVGVITEKELADRPAQSVVHMLQGTMPGLNITTSSGKPGDTASINVRGTTSVNESAPLILIDGVEGDLNHLNPSDVKNISVIKDASAAAIYGARAAFGVILVTTKTGADTSGHAKVRYSGRFGWETNTTSTEFEERGYWSVFTVNTFSQARNGTNYVNYTEKDMAELWARVNDRKEVKERPWVIEDVRNGRNQWVYYGNYDHYHMNFSDTRPKMQHLISLSGGTSDIHYFLSGGYEYRKGILKYNPDTYNKYNLRAKIDFKVNKITTLYNNTSFFGSTYNSQGNGSIQDTFAYSATSGLSCFPNKNPDGSWVYSVPYMTGKMANGRHIMIGEGSHRNTIRTFDFCNSTRLIVAPSRHLTLTADFTYRFNQERQSWRSNHLNFREYPDVEMEYYGIGAGQNKLKENVYTNQTYSVNAFATYVNTWGEKHNFSATAGYNFERWANKNVSAEGFELSSVDLDDLSLATKMNTMAGGQNEYKLSGWFGRVNYDYDGRYLAEISGRYDGSSRFASKNRWGWFPSGSIGWRISEEPFFEQARDLVDNLKLRVSYGSLGNQNVSSYYTFLRMISINNFATFNFGEDNVSKYSSIGAPIADDLTWETSRQWNAGIDYAMLNNRLTFTGDFYVRNTVNMLTDGVELPAVYGATVPQMNTADLRTKGYELALSWRDSFDLLSKPFSYSIGVTLSDYKSEITRYDNEDKVLSKKYYKGMRLGEIWGYSVDGLFASDEDAMAYSSNIDMSYVAKSLGPENKWRGGDMKFVDLDGDGVISIGENTVNKPGDRKIIGNSLPSLQYGVTGTAQYAGFDLSVFFQGTGNHYWYPHGYSMLFWGAFAESTISYLPRDFMSDVWSPENPDAYFTRPMMNSAINGTLSFANDRYLQNIRYLRLKNLTVGYTLPQDLTKNVGIYNLRIYFTGENLTYWSPLKKHSKYIDPESAFDRSSNALNRIYYPWAKTYMFGVDLSF